MEEAMREDIGVEPLNVAGIVGLGIACALAQREMAKNAEHILALRDYLETELLKIEGTSVNGNIQTRPL